MLLLIQSIILIQNAYMYAQTNVIPYIILLWLNKNTDIKNKYTHANSNSIPIQVPVLTLMIR